MSVTIMEVLQSARINLTGKKRTPLSDSVGREQLKNAVTLLEKGYSLDDDFDKVMGEAENAEDVMPSILDPCPKSSSITLTFEEWKTKLIEVTAEKARIPLHVIKINDQEAKKWFDDGFTPYQCFRETWQMENDIS